MILRAVFGAEGPALEELRELLPSAIASGSPFALLPPGARRELLGPWKPWQKFLDYRRRYDAIVQTLIDEARADIDFEARTDVLSRLLRARYEDGEAISETGTSRTSYSRCSPPVTRPPRLRWRGRSSGYAGIRSC